MPWYDANFAYKKSLVIPHGNVSGGSDFLDFPLLVSITDAALKSESNGGLVASSSGYDLLFTDGTETRELPYEVDSYTASTGALIAWVRLPVLSAAQDTVLYLYFGNSAVTGFQSTAANVWNSTYLRVYHLGNGSSLSVADSTSHAANGTNNGATATTGIIDGGASFNGTSNYISVPTTGLPTGASPFTAGCWVEFNSIPAGGTYGVMLALGSNSSLQGTTIYYGDASQHLSDGVKGGGYVDGGAIAATTPYYLVSTFDGTTVSYYVNGVLKGTFTQASLNLAYGACYIGQDVPSGSYFPGIIDEVRIATGARTASWIATEYTNQSNPSSFLIVGQTLPGTGDADLPLLVASSVTTTQTSADQLNVADRGVELVLNTTTLPGGDTLTLTLQGKDVTSGQYYTVASFSGIGSGTSTFTVYPGLPASSTVVSGILPRTWRVQVQPSTGGSATYTVGASLLS